MAALQTNAASAEESCVRLLGQAAAMADSIEFARTSAHVMAMHATLLKSVSNLSLVVSTTSFANFLTGGRLKKSSSMMRAISKACWLFSEWWQFWQCYHRPKPEMTVELCWPCSFNLPVEGLCCLFVCIKLAELKWVILQVFTIMNEVHE